MCDSKEIRRQIDSIRRNLTEQEVRQSAIAIAQKIFEMPEYRDSKCVMAYMAVRGEADLAFVLDDIIAHRKLVLPQCRGSEEMIGRAVPDKKWVKIGAFGILEPDDACEPINPGEIDLILVPGVAFTLNGDRIGHGCGYYDRFLAQTDAVRVGIAYDFQIQNVLPQNNWDMPMDYIITPTRCIRSNNRSRA